MAQDMKNSSQIKMTSPTSFISSFIKSKQVPSVPNFINLTKTKLINNNKKDKITKHKRGKAKRFSVFVAYNLMGARNQVKEAENSYE
jgi:hypothetical protein